MFDLLLTQGRIFDGFKFLPENTNVGVEEGKIAYIGMEYPDSQKVRDLDCSILSPAFVDSHTHSDICCRHATNNGASALSQGIGTQVIGNCGYSLIPGESPSEVLIPDSRFEELPNHAPDFMPLHTASLLGHNSLRKKFSPTSIQPDKRAQHNMRSFLATTLEDGGLGLSVGLNYPDAEGTSHVELLPLCQELARHNRVLSCHIRDQGRGILEAMDEVIALGRESGCKVLISHLRPISNKFDHYLDSIISRIESDDRIAFDLYPYVAGFTSLSWLFQHLFNHLPRPGNLIDCAELELGGEEVCIGGLSQIAIIKHRNSAYINRNISYLATARGETPGKVIQDIYLEDVSCLSIFHKESSEDILDSLISHPKCFLGSDGYLFDSSFDDACHPRTFAAFTGFIDRYINSKKVPLEQGFSRITGAPAEFLNLLDVGTLRLGASANYTIFNPEALRENASYEHPTRLSRGIEELVLDGQLAWGEDKCNSRAGRDIKAM